MMKRIIQRTAAVTLGLTLSAIVWASLEVGTYISDLVTTNPLSTDLSNTADDHLRLIKSTIKATFANVNGAVTSTDEELNIVDGVTATAAELNTLDGVAATLTATELNLLDGITGTVWSSGNDGVGSGLDADTLDTFSSAAFVRAVTASMRIAGMLQVGGNPCIIGTNYGVTSCVRDSAGTYTVNLTAAGFTSAPVCVSTANFTGVSWIFTAPTSTSVTVRTATVDATLTDAPFFLQCMAP